MILKIYWNEFKTFRTQYKELIIEKINEKIDQQNNLGKHIMELFKKNKLYFNGSEDVFTNVVDYIDENERKENIQCKICYNAKASVLLIHTDQACTICSTCVDKFSLNTECPFCKMDIKDNIFLYGPFKCFF
jgi:frataxin-like iron-binding protein CyaY